MIIKKQFAIHEYLEEEKFLSEQAKEGKCLVKVFGDEYEFKACESVERQYKVFYSLTHFDPKVYQGFKLLTTFTSSEGGHYYYLLVEDEFAKLPPNKDRNFILEKNLRRIERFNGIIIGSLLIFFIFLYLTHRNPLYFIIILAAIAMSIYVYNLRSKIKKAIEKTV